MMSPWPRYGVRRALVHLAFALFALCGSAALAADRLIWVLGDSLAAGYGLPPADGFTVQLERALRDAGVKAAVRNGGIAGDTAAQGRARLAWGLRGLGAKPDLVIVELGANDMLRGQPPAITARNLGLILAELQRRRIRVLVAGMRAAPNLGPDYRREFEALYPKLARKYRNTLYPFFLDGVAAQPKLLQNDGRHPNARGVKIIVQLMLPAVIRSLGE